jgi:hypothetical protein
VQGGRLCWLAYGSSTPGSAAHLAPQARRLSVRETRGKEVRVHGRTLDPCGWMGSCMVTPVVVRLRGTCLRGGECPVSFISREDSVGGACWLEAHAASRTL